MKISSIILFLLTLTTFSCKKEGTTTDAKKLEGNWKVTSYIFDGNEVIDDLQSFIYNFGAYNSASNEGIVTTTTVEGTGDTVTSQSTYTVNDSSNTLTITSEDIITGDTYEDIVNYDIAGDQLTLEGNLHGTALEYTIVADKQ